MRQSSWVLQLNLGSVPGLTPTLVPGALPEPLFESVPEEGLGLVELEQVYEVVAQEAARKGVHGAVHWGAFAGVQRGSGPHLGLVPVVVLEAVVGLSPEAAPELVLEEVLGSTLEVVRNLSPEGVLGVVPRSVPWPALGLFQGAALDPCLR